MKNNPLNSEEPLVIEQGNLRNILNSMQDGVYIVNAQYEILYINPALEKDFGPVAGRKCYQYFHERQSVCPWCKSREVLDGRSVRWEWWSARTGKTYDLLDTPLRTSDGNILKLEIFRDITELKKTQQKLQSSHRFLEIANRHAEMDPLLDEFVREIGEATRCSAVGIRILDRQGNIPFLAYRGFSRKFYEMENPLCVRTGECACIRVVGRRVDPDLPGYTTRGSFFVNSTSRFLKESKAAGIGCRVCNHHGYETLALVPIRQGEHILGLIHVADPLVDRLSLETLELLEDGAMQLGAAIKRVRAEEELRRSHEKLERRVRLRTSELDEINAELRRQIAEREAAESALRNSENELRVLSERLLSAEEKERKRIAGELHDGIGQALSAMKFGVENALGALRGASVEDGIAALEALIPYAQSTIEDVRRIVADLRPSILDDLGILATLSWFCREFQELYSSIGIETAVELSEEDVPDRLKTVIYRVVQEAFNNIARHSGATKVQLLLRRDEGHLRLYISDNGIGFDPKRIARMKRSDRGFGLASMRERTALSGGHFQLSAGNSGGTRIEVVWFLEAAEKPARHVEEA
jgi:PAS domain S-box-containing protein